MYHCFYHRFVVYNALFELASNKHVKTKALFLDRDGIINELHYDPEHGVIESPLNPKHVCLVFGIAPLIKHAKKLGYMIVIISNQPNLALNKTSEKTFDTITKRIHSLLLKEGAKVDAEYYCFHHPFGKIKKYKQKCICRKPNEGLFLKASKEHGIDLKSSWMIGDGISDILSGNKAGCKTILLANTDSTENFRIIKKELKNSSPNHIVKKLNQVEKIIKK